MAPALAMPDSQGAAIASQNGEASNEADATAYDLSSKMMPHLDRHLCMPLIDFLDDLKLYPHAELMQAKLQLLKTTNMVTAISELDKEISSDGQGQADVQADCSKRKDAILDNLKALESQANVVMDIITVPEVFQALKQDKQQNLQFLKSQHNLTLEQIEVLYKVGRFQYTIGQYQSASDYLYHFRVLTTDVDLESSAMWGKLVADILDGSWDAALAELDLIKRHIDAHFPPASASANAVVGLQQRTWFLHWSLFVFFNHPEGRDQLVDTWMSQTLIPHLSTRDNAQTYYLQNFLPTLQANAPWLLRYLVVAVVLSKKAAFKGNSYLGANSRLASREQLGTAILTAVKQEVYQYSDPVTEFIRLLFVEVNLEAASKMLPLTEQVFANDFFLSDFRDEWRERARWLYSEVYCRLHNQIDIASLSKQLGISTEEGERWIVRLIRDARMDAKIDLKENIVNMNKTVSNTQQTVIDRTKSILERSQRIDVIPEGQQQYQNEGGYKGRRQQQQQSNQSHAQR